MGSVFIDPAELDDGFYGWLQLAQLFFVYSYILFIGCNLISDGAELLMLTRWSKLVGSCILPVLGAVPDGAIVLFSGLGKDAQSSLDVGVGALAGSTVMLITIPWALAIYGGRVDLDAAGAPRYGAPRGQPRLSPGRFWTSGVSVGEGHRFVRVMAKWMLFTALPYVVIEVGAVVSEAQNGGITSHHGVDADEAKKLALQESPAALVGLLLAFASFVAYLRSQVGAAYGPAAAASPELEDRQRQSAVRAVARGGVGLVAAIKPILESMEVDIVASPLRGDEERALVAADAGRAMLRAVLRPFFAKYDDDRSETLDLMELSRVFADMNEPLSADDVEALFADYDVDGSGVLSFPEFCDGMEKFVRRPPLSRTDGETPRPRSASRADGEPRPRGASRLSDTGDDDDDDDEVPEEFAPSKFKTVAEQQAAIQRRALIKCGLGTLLVLVFSDPITDVLAELGRKTGIAAFYVGFVVAPLITNGSEVLASYTFALKKTQKSMVVAYEQLLGAAVMNNTYCLCIFLVLIYSQDLYWNYTAEVLAILAAELAIFVIATSVRVHTMRTAALVLAVYPAALLTVWILQNLAGIS